jgi:hypothetical protein
MFDNRTKCHQQIVIHEDESKRTFRRVGGYEAHGHSVPLVLQIGSPLELPHLLLLLQKKS